MGTYRIAGVVSPGDIERLRKTIEQFNEKSGRQTTQMLYLTWVVAVLTAVLTVLTAWLVFEG